MRDGKTLQESIFSPAPQFSGPAMTPMEMEANLRIKRPCSTFAGAFFCGMEWDEWQLVKAFVRPENMVLELGARLGTTSCVLAQQTGNIGRVVSVEPDTKAHRPLLRNRARHNCSFHVVRGAVGDTPLAMSSRFSHYATQTQLAAAGEPAIPSIDLTWLERRVGGKFDTLLIDCEGCIEGFFRGGNHRLLSQLSTIIIEEDAPAQVEYRKWHAKLRRHGLERVWKVRDTFDPGAPWSRNISHSVWRRGGGPWALGDRPSCPQYAESAKLSRRWLDCMDPSDEKPMVAGCSSDPCVPPRG